VIWLVAPGRSVGQAGLMAFTPINTQLFGIIDPPGNRARRQANNALTPGE
jgi:hypothetical protein